MGKAITQGKKKETLDLRIMAANTISLCSSLAAHGVSLSHKHTHALAHTSTAPLEDHTMGGLSQLAQSQGAEGDILS